MFRGRTARHRVTPVEGAHPRLLAVLSYDPAGQDADRAHPGAVLRPGRLRKESAASQSEKPREPLPENAAFPAGLIARFARDRGHRRGVVGTSTRASDRTFDVLIFSFRAVILLAYPMTAGIVKDTTFSALSPWSWP